MAESTDEKCIDEEGDPCMYSELCKGKPYGWGGCLIVKTEKIDSVPVERRVRPAVCEWRKNGDYNLPGHETSCGEEYVFDAAPLEDMLGDSYIYCPKCGGEIKHIMGEIT